MLEQVKKALRVNSSVFDDEITDLINAAKRDLEVIGVVVNENDDLILQAIKTYCKSEFFIESEASERLMESYKSQRDKLSLCGEYNG